MTVFLYATPSISQSIDNNDMTIKKAIGHMIFYQTERRINGQAGLNSPLTEVFKTYYQNIEPLPKSDRAMFLFMADNHLKIHGGSDLLDYYNFIYLCCSFEYQQLLEKNLSNPYFNSEELKRKWDIVRNLDSSIKKEASWKKRSFKEHKLIMKAEFMEMIKVVNDKNYKISD